MRRETISKMLRVCDSELEKRMWGAKLPNGKGKIRRYLITDFRAFGLITGIARYLVKSEEKEERIFYRGQAEEWVLKPKLYRDCNTKIEIELANKWKEKALEIALQEGFDYRGKEENVADYREALAQHYGLATSFIDVVDHIQTALWFAYDRLHKESSVGYIYMVSVPKERSILIDLRDKPSEWLRPHIEQAFCFKMKKVTELGKISERYHIMTFVIPRDLLAIWNSCGMFTNSFVYPPKKLDRGLEYWEKVEKRLKEEGLGLEPTQWIQKKISEKGQSVGKWTEI